jgi:hypothetical protein
MIASLSADQRSITMAGAKGWKASFPVSALPEWLAFYRRMRERGGKGKGAPGPHAAHYEPTIRALERVQRIVAVMSVSA